MTVQRYRDKVMDPIVRPHAGAVGLDPIPTWLVKRCLGDLAGTITSLVDTSLAVRTVPSAMKVPNITPKQKKTV